MKIRKSTYTRFNLSNLLETLKQQCVGPLLTINFWYSIAFTLFQVNFVLVSKEGLGLDAQATSLLLSLVGVLAVITQGFIVGFLVKRFKETRLMFVSTIVLIVSLIGWSFANNVWLLALILVPTAISAGIFNVLISSQITKAVYKENVGGTLGITQSQQALAQVVAPLIGGFLIQFVGTYAVGLAGALLMGIAAIYEKIHLIGRGDLTGPCVRNEVEAIGG